MRVVTRAAGLSGMSSRTVVPEHLPKGVESPERKRQEENRGEYQVANTPPRDGTRRAHSLPHPGALLTEESAAQYEEPPLVRTYPPPSTSIASNVATRRSRASQSSWLIRVRSSDDTASQRGAAVCRT